MENQAFTLLMKMLEDQKTHNDHQFDNIHSKLEEVLEFRYKLLGGSIVISIIGGAVFHLVVSYMIGGH